MGTKIDLVALCLSVLAFLFALVGTVSPEFAENQYVLKTDRWHLPFHFMHYISSTPCTLTSNRIYAIPFFFPRAMKVTKIGIGIMNDDSMLNDAHGRIGLYNSSDCYPSSLIEASNSIILYWGGTTNLILTFASPQNLSGLYWGALLLSDESDVLQCYECYSSHPRDTMEGTNSLLSSTGYQDLVFYKTQTYGTLPNPFPSGASSTHQYNLGLQVFITEML